MGFMIGLAGVVVLVLASLGGFLVSAGSRSSRRAVVAVLGAVCVVVFLVWGGLSEDGQPWAVWMSKRGAGNTDEVTDGPLTGLIFRTLLNAAGFGLLLSWALVVGVERRRKTDD